MEKASGELSLTVITIIAVAALAGIITLLVPNISNWINNSFNTATGTAVDLNNGKK